MRHHLVLLHSDSVFTGDRTSHLNTVLQNLLARGLGFVDIAGFMQIEQYDRMHVAVTRVKDVTDAQSVFLAHLADMAQRWRNLRAGHDAVLYIVRSAHASDGPECILAALP